MVQVRVQQGVLEGELLQLVTGEGEYYSFKGVPYAAPPTGKLRFKAPQPPLPWEGVRQAKAHGAICPQLDIFTNELLPGEEDCLFLNVYTKTIKPESPLPVMVFIHGGGFKSGSGNESHYGPDFIVDQDVVLVTINYRLEVLGFLCLDTKEVSGNAGLKDQSAALKWVKENISSFGGDSNNITIFGESAGGASVMFHTLSLMSKGLFQKAIAMSGAPTCDWSLAFKPQDRAFKLGKQLGLDTKDPNELLDYLQSLPVDKLIDVNPNLLGTEVVNNTILKMYHFTPVVEKDFGQETFIKEAPLKMAKEGRMNDVHLFAGNTNEETVVGIPWMENLTENYNQYPECLVPRELLIQCNSETNIEVSKIIHQRYFNNKMISTQNIREFVTYCNDIGFIYDIQRCLNSMHINKKNNKLFYYRFASFSDRNHYGKSGAKYGLTGASHLDDLLYLFDAKIFKMDVDTKSKEYELIKLATTVFTNFAKYGTPTPDGSLGLTWPEFSPAADHIVEIQDRLKLVPNNNNDIYNFWKSIFDFAGVEY